MLIKLYTIAGINLQAGPQFGFLSRAEIDDQNVKDSFKKSDISLALGAGWDLPFGLTVDARYNLGLSKIDDTATADKIKNQVWQISVGDKIGQAWRWQLIGNTVLVKKFYKPRDLFLSTS